MGDTDELGNEERQLLAQMEAINREIEMDTKSVKSLRICSRQNSFSSQISGISLCINAGEDEKPNPDTISTCSDRGKLSVNAPSPSAASLNSSGGANTSNALNSNSQEDDNWELWGRIVNNWEQYSKKKSQIKDLVRAGVPHHFRPLVWQMLSNAYEDGVLKKKYAEYLKKPSPCEKAIRRDIARTYPKHEMFKEKDGFGQESLFNVMKAYSLHDREVGYCQGSGFIVGLVLMQMPEEEAFSVLVHLMQDYRLRDLFKPSMDELGLCMYQLESLLQDNLPALFMHFQAQGFTTTLYASSWFLTLFTTTFSVPFACRIMDLFICEGMEIIFKIGIAYLLIIADHLVNLDMESMLKYLQDEAQTKLEQEPNFLFDVAFAVKINPKKMKRLEKEYQTLKAKEHTEQTELRRLRTENGLLLQRIERLEKDNTRLNVKRTESEEISQLRQDLSTALEHCREVSLRLVEAEQVIEQLKMETPLSPDISSKRQTLDLIQQLQSELVAIRLKEAETNSNARDLKEKCRLLEEENQKLKKNPASELQRTKDELDNVRIQLHESIQSNRESKKNLMELQELWQQHAKHCDSSPKSSSQKAANQLNQEIMTLRLREANLSADYKETKQKMFGLEAQQEICSQQIARRDEEFIRIKEQLLESLDREKRLRYELSDVERKCADIESKRKEDGMLWRIREMEALSKGAELEQKVASLESHCQELLSSTQINDQPGSQASLDRRLSKSSQSSANVKPKSSRTDEPAASSSDSVPVAWKDLPPSIMTESIGPLNDICFVPDDPLITSIYIDQPESHTENQPVDNLDTPPVNGDVQSIFKKEEENPDLPNIFKKEEENHLVVKSCDSDSSKSSLTSLNSQFVTIQSSSS